MDLVDKKDAPTQTHYKSPSSSSDIVKDVLLQEYSYKKAANYPNVYYQTMQHPQQPAYNQLQGNFNCNIKRQKAQKQVMNVRPFTTANQRGIKSIVHSRNSLRLLQNKPSTEEKGLYPQELQKQMVYSQSQKAFSVNQEANHPVQYFTTSLKSYVKSNQQQRIFSATNANRVVTSKGHKDALQRLGKNKNYFTFQGKIIPSSESDELDLEIQQFLRQSTAVEVSPKRKMVTRKELETVETPDLNFNTIEDKEVDWTQSYIFTNKTINERVGSPNNQNRFAQTIHATQPMQRRQIDVITGKVLNIKSPQARLTSVKAFYSYGRQIQNKIQKQQDIFGQESSQERKKLKFLQRFQIQSEKLQQKKPFLMSIQEQKNTQSAQTFITSAVEKDDQQMQRVMSSQKAVELQYNNIKIPTGVISSLDNSRQPSRLKPRKNLSQGSFEVSDNKNIIEREDIPNELSKYQSLQKLTMERALLLYKQLQGFQENGSFIANLDVIDSITGVKGQKELLSTRYQSLNDFKKSNEMKIQVNPYQGHTQSPQAKAGAFKKAESYPQNSRNISQTQMLMIKGEGSLNNQVK